MPFSNMESNTVYPELRSFMTEKGRAQLYSTPFITELDQATFHRLMQKSAPDADSGKYHTPPRRYALVNEYEVRDGALHLVGELLDLRTLKSQGLVESTGDPANPEQAVTDYIGKIQNTFFSKRREVSDRTIAKKSKMSPPEKQPEVQPKVSSQKPPAPSKAPPKAEEVKTRLSEFNRTVQALTELLTVDTLYAIQYEEPTLQALTGAADTYEAWVEVELTPTADLVHFLKTNKYVRNEGKYAVLTLPASLESLPAEFRSLLEQGYGNLAVKVDFYAPDNSEIEPVGNSQFLEQKEDYNTLAGQQLLPVQMLQTNRTVKLYFLTSPRTIDAVVPVYLPNTLRIDRIDVGLAPQ